MAKEKITMRDAFEQGSRLGTDITKTRATIAERLREIRMHRGLKQGEIAKMADLNPTTYCGYENGVSTPSVAVLVRIADAYDVSLDFLAGRTNNENGVFAERQESTLLDRFAKLEAAVEKIQNKDT